MPVLQKYVFYNVGTDGLMIPSNKALTGPKYDLNSRLKTKGFTFFMRKSQREKLFFCSLPWETDLSDFDFIAASDKYRIMRELLHSHAKAVAPARMVRIFDQLKAAGMVIAFRKYVDFFHTLPTEAIHCYRYPARS